MRHTVDVVVEDGDVLNVFVREIQPSVWDPASEVSGVARSYKVVAEKCSAPVVELVPIQGPVNVSTHGMQMIEKRAIGIRTDA